MTSKEKFQSFIDRFYLGGTNDRAIIKATATGMDVIVYNKQTACGTEVYLTEPIFEVSGDTLIAMYNVDAFSRIIKSFEDPKFEIGYRESNRNDTDPFAILVKQEGVNAKYTLSRPEIIDNRNKIDGNRFVWKVELPLPVSLTDEILKFSSVLKGFDTFSFVSKAGKLFIRFGGQHNSSENKIELALPTTEAFTPFESAVKFNIDIFKSILTSNKGSDISLKINDMLYSVTAKSDLFTSVYYNSSKK